MDFLSYYSEAQPRGGLCIDSVDVNAPLIVSGFGFNHSNTRNQASLIDSTNVDILDINFHYAPANSNEKRGAPAVTAQAIFLKSGRELVAINRESGCQYWTFTTPDTRGSSRSASILFVPASETASAVVYAADSNGYVYAVRAESGEALWQTFAGTNPTYHFITGGMQHYQGKLFVPLSSKELLETLFDPEACCKSHGVLAVPEANTGASSIQCHQWRTYQRLCGNCLS